MTDLRWRSAICAVLLAGWFVPLAIAATYDYALLPGDAEGGRSAAYVLLDSYAPWPIVWLVVWIIATGCLAFGFLGAMGAGRPAEIAPARVAVAALWTFAAVQAGSFIVAAFLSSGLNDLGPLGIVPGGWIWSMGVLAGVGAAMLAVVISVLRRIRPAREA